jgi:hypothetical protein
MGMNSILQSANEPLPSVNLGFDGQDPTPRLEDFYLSKKGSLVIRTVLESLGGNEKENELGQSQHRPARGNPILLCFWELSFTITSLGTKTYLPF